MAIIFYQSIAEVDAVAGDKSVWHDIANSRWVVRTGADMENGTNDNTEVLADLKDNYVYPPRDVPVETPGSAYSYLFAHPATLAGHKQLGQIEVYVPLQKDPTDGIQWYYGTCLGTKAAAHMVPSICDTGLYKPALHSYHTAMTKTGSWATSPANVAEGAFTANGAASSSTAGDTISGTVSGRAIGVRWFATTDGGFAVVSIDGDYTRATRLPEFTQADYLSGACRESDVGKRYLCTYYPAPWNDASVIADDLAPGNHTIVIQSTGKRPGASSGTKVYIEAIFGVGGGALGAFKVFAVPIRYVCHLSAVSAQCYVAQWAPAGTTSFEWLGENHSDNSNSLEETADFVVLVEQIDKTALTKGTFASGTTVTVRHTTTLAHASDLGSAVANKTRTYTFKSGRKHPAMCAVKIEWLADGVLEIEYAAMLTVGSMIVAPELGACNWDFTTGEISRNEFPFLAIDDGAIYQYRGDDCKVFARGEQVEAWAAVIEQSAGNQMYSSYAGSYQDRTATNEEKLYCITSSGRQSIPAGTVREFVVGWGARRIGR